MLGRRFGQSGVKWQLTQRHCTESLRQQGANPTTFTTGSITLALCELGYFCKAEENILVS
jgi:hypothetical protein